MIYPRIMLSGTTSRVGKTTLAMGIISALKKRRLKVQPFKAGPDYIDPSYHTHVSDRACRNLDTWMLSRDAVLEIFERHAKEADISIIEGAMGLYDGLGDTEEGSSAHLAKITATPVILIVDAKSMSRSAGAVVLGYKEFDKDLDLRGVILNNIGSSSHYRNAKSSIENKTGVPVLGFLPKDKGLVLPERHLGLVPASEDSPLDEFTDKLRSLVESNIDMEKIIEISRSARDLPGFKRCVFAVRPGKPRVTIAVAKNAAFNFYYQDNLDILRDRGAELVDFDPIRDKALPEGTDGLYIGGGFPELFAGELSANEELKGRILDEAQRGMPIYAECGGLMYLVKEIVGLDEGRFPMVGIFDAVIKMTDRLSALGYVNIETTGDNILSRRGKRLRGHVFHWSRIDDAGRQGSFAYRLEKAGRDPSVDGLTRWNTLASYAHIHFASDPGLAEALVKSCDEYRVRRGKE